MTQNILTCFKFITIINIINYVITKNTFIINYLLICTLTGIFYIIIDSDKNKLNILTDKINIISLLILTSIMNTLYIINIKITNLKYIIFISLFYIIIKYISKKA
nr:MAG TPA: hypothetical protein [Caudoviricetes sp.]